jgi:hypothetical protein
VRERDRERDKKENMCVSVYNKELNTLPEGPIIVSLPLVLADAAKLILN